MVMTFERALRGVFGASYLGKVYISRGGNG
jgi:hypothetical protein